MSYPPDIKLEDVPCPLGCTAGDDKVLTGRDKLHGLPGEFTIVKCHRCGLMRTNPRPTPETIGFYYPDDYGPYHGTRINLAKNSRGDHPFWRRLARQVFHFNNDLLPLLPAGRMLEVGCASGSFLHLMAAKGWEVEGVEFSPKAAESARSLGYIIHTGPLETAPEPDYPYDLVVGWMVLEHLHNPISALQKLYRWTKPGGWLVVSVPNAGSLEFQFFRGNWYALHLPNHLYHFTPRTLKMVLENEGWRMDRIFHQRVLSNLIGSLGHVLQGRQYMPRLAGWLIDFPKHGGKKRYLLYPLACSLAALGQTGRMTIWAKKMQ